jgi:pyridoxamine 5'-phosphate oxidase
MQLADIRREYILKALDESHIKSDPLLQFEQWLNEAIEAMVNEPTAMALATATPRGVPSLRIVLLKGLSEQGFGFFTNYTSRKGEEIALNQHVAILLYWPELERQVRVEGVASKTSEYISDAYFKSRPYESRLSAVISNQSKVVPDREFLEQLWQNEHNLSVDHTVTRPDYWGGYVIKPLRIEFWQGRPNRLHDRILYTRDDDSWTISRLAP